MGAIAHATRIVYNLLGIENIIDLLEYNDEYHPLIIGGLVILLSVMYQCRNNKDTSQALR